jgi:hypothetical protein
MMFTGAGTAYNVPRGPGQLAVRIRTRAGSLDGVLRRKLHELLDQLGAGFACKLAGLLTRADHSRSGRGADRVINMPMTLHAVL